MKLYWPLLLGLLVYFNLQALAQTGKLRHSDPPVSKKTRALFYNLKNMAGQGIIFGHQDALAYGIGWKEEKDRSDVKDVAGAYPGLVGWEIGDIGQPHNLDTVYFKNMRQWIKQVYKMGAVNSISWHMDNPVTLGSSWDNTPAVYAILPGGEKHEAYKAKLDLVADFVKSLKAGWFTRIPVIFRPFHEHTGSWFWWGKDHATPEEYKALWQFTVDYLRKEKKLNNILFAYSTDIFNSREQFLENYPGDEYVDILGFDDYHSLKKPEGKQLLVNQLKMLVEIAEEKGKVAAFTETGFEKVPINNWWTDFLLDAIKTDPVGSKISYVMIWRNAWPHHHYAPYPGHPSAENFRKFKSDPFTYFQDNLPDMYKLP